MKFEEMGLSKSLLDSLQAMKFTVPTPIQEQAIPLLLRGGDLIGQAQTGTGKTAAFGLPIFEALLKARNAPQHRPSQIAVPADPFAHQPQLEKTHTAHDARRIERHERPQRFAPGHAMPSALILVPTRELAVQVSATLHKMSGNPALRTVAVYGGVEMRKQLRMFHSPVDVLVGTPGRTLDHMHQGTLRLNEVRIVVLDEADRMLDMGFLRDVTKILNATPQHRQTMLFSATITHELAQIAHRYMRNPTNVKVSEDSLAVEGIKQIYVRCNNGQRMGMLLAAIRAEKPKLSLVFCRMKHEAKKLARVLKHNGIRADAMHGNLSQNARERAMERFRSGDIELLVATDLASRGIDVPGITHVFNYELPPDPTTYVHRIGRTGRAGRVGTAISLITQDPKRIIRGLENATGSKISEMVLAPEEIMMPEAHAVHNAMMGRPQGRREWPRNRDREHGRPDQNSSDRHHPRNSTTDGHSGEHHHAGGRARPFHRRP